MNKLNALESAAISQNRKKPPAYICCLDSSMEPKIGISSGSTMAKTVALVAAPIRNDGQSIHINERHLMMRPPWHSCLPLPRLTHLAR